MCSADICVEVKDPLKQGLKHIIQNILNTESHHVEVKDPLKQGLKRKVNCSLY